MLYLCTHLPWGQPSCCCTVRSTGGGGESSTLPFEIPCSDAPGIAPAQPMCLISV